MVYFLMEYLKTFWHHLKKHEIRRIVLTTLFLILLGSGAFYYLERGVNQSIDEYWDALWWIIVTMTTVGYGDLFPVTWGGRILAIFVMLAGIGLLSIVIGVFASVIQSINLRKEMGRLAASFKDHIVICGWSEKAEQIIKELHSNRVEGENPVVLVANIEANPLDEDTLVHFVRGRSDSDEVLKRAGVQRARSVIVLNEDGQDATTVLSCLSVRRLNPTVNIVAEVNKPENRFHFEVAKVNEIIVDSEINSRLLLRSALHSGIYQLIEELTTVSYGNEIYKMPMTEKWLNKPFKDVHFAFYDEHRAILIGIIRDGKVTTNPSAGLLLKAGDELVYIAAEAIQKSS